MTIKNFKEDKQNDERRRYKREDLADEIYRQPIDNWRSISVKKVEGLFREKIGKDWHSETRYAEAWVVEKR